MKRESSIDLIDLPIGMDGDCCCSVNAPPLSLGAERKVRIVAALSGSSIRAIRGNYGLTTT